MYIEASDPRVENDTARLFSPVFAASQSVDACFSLWYHMWGSSLGENRGESDISQGWTSSVGKNRGERDILQGWAVY